LVGPGLAPLVGNVAGPRPSADFSSSTSLVQPVSSLDVREILPSADYARTTAYELDGAAAVRRFEILGSTYHMVELHP
jgi:hypothetical protein